MKTEYVMVEKGALQMVRNALRSDMEAGRTVRGEMLEELDKATYDAPKQEAEPVAVSQEVKRVYLVAEDCVYEGLQMYSRHDECVWGADNEVLYSAQPPAVAVQGDPVVDDLSALVRRLAHSLKKANSDSGLPRLAMDYLHRHGLQGSILRERPAQPAPVPTSEIGWLIENGSNTQTMYRCIDNADYMRIEWTPDPNKALRFARREDAQAFSYHDEDTYRIKALAERE